MKAKLKSNSENKNIIRSLERIVGKKYVFSSIEDLIVHSYDASAPSNLQQPICAVSPGTAEEIEKILKAARTWEVSVVVRGAGTGLAGAAGPADNSIILLTNRMDKILEIDPKNLTAWVEPGVITKDLAAAVEKQGLFYPPDPSSMAVSTIGGNIALDSGGLRGLKYGVTKDYVMGLEVVLASGEILRTGGKCKKDAAGYNLTSLFVGSEGTLGIITKALLRLIPLPETQKTAVALFEDVRTAAQVAAAVIEKRIIPVTLELMDDLSLRCVEAFAQLGLPEAGAMLLIEVDGPQEIVEKEIGLVRDICLRHGALSVEVAQSESEAEKLKAARRSTLAALARQKPTTIIEDVTVPRSEIPEMVEAIKGIAERYAVEIAVFGHAGDGNLHPTAMIDERDRDELKRAEAAFDEIFMAALKLGGTITGEHGVGIKKKHMLPEQAGQTGMEVMKTIKASLDPENILNPSKIFDL